MNKTFPAKTIKLLTTALFLLLAMNTGQASAQSTTETPTPTPESEEIIRLREEKTRSELEKDIAVAERAELDAKFPKPTTTPLAGETTVNEGAVIESEMVSYLSMAYAANRIVDRLKTSKMPGKPTEKLVINNLAIYNKEDVNLLLNYNVTTNQLEIVRQGYCKILAPGTDPEKCPADDDTRGGQSRLLGAPLSIASSLLGSFVDLTALLRTDVVIQGHIFNIDEASLVSEVFRAMRADDGLTTNSTVSLYYPATFPPNIDVNQESQILGQLELLYDLKAKVETIIGNLEENVNERKKTEGKIETLKATIKELEAKIKDAEAEISRLERLRRLYGRRLPFEAVERLAKLRDTLADLNRQLAEANLNLQKAKDALTELERKQTELLAPLSRELRNPAKLDDTLSKLKMLNQRFDNLVAALIKTDASTGINSLTAYIRAENLRSVLNDKEHSYWLQLAVVKAGGNNRIKTNLLIDIFTGGNRLSHSGGAIVQYALYDLNGRSIVSDTLTEYTGYIKAGKIKRLPNPQRIDETPQRKPVQP